MRKASSFFLFLFILICACGTAFYLGFSPLKVSHDKIGVLVSKTSGVCEKSIVPGTFMWNWELLIPNNSKIREFSIKPFTYKYTKSGMLPSGDVYSKQLRENPDFSYFLTYDIEITYDADECVKLVKESDISSDSDLQIKLSSFAEQIITKATTMVMAQVADGKNPDFEDIKAKIINECSGKGYTVSVLNFTDVKLPDASLYKASKDIYMNYLSSVENNLMKLSEAQAKEISEYTKNLNKLEKFGKVLQEHPELADFLKSSKDMNETLKTIYSFQ